MGCLLSWDKGLKDLKVQGLNSDKGENTNITTIILTFAIKKKASLIIISLLMICQHIICEEVLHLQNYNGSKLNHTVLLYLKCS